MPKLLKPGLAYQPANIVEVSEADLLSLYSSAVADIPKDRLCYAYEKPAEVSASKSSSGMLHDEQVKYIISSYIELCPLGYRNVVKANFEYFLRHYVEGSHSWKSIDDYNVVKKYLEKILFVLKTKDNPTSIQSILLELSSQLTHCAPGIFSSLPQIYIQIATTETVEYWLAEYRTGLTRIKVDQYYHNNYALYGDGQHVHVTDAFFHCSNLLGINPIVDQRSISLDGDVYIGDILKTQESAIKSVLEDVFLNEYNFKKIVDVVVTRLKMHLASNLKSLNANDQKLLDVSNSADSQPADSQFFDIYNLINKLFLPISFGIDDDYHPSPFLLTIEEQSSGNDKTTTRRLMNAAELNSSLFTDRIRPYVVHYLRKQQIFSEVDPDVAVINMDDAGVIFIVKNDFENSYVKYSNRLGSLREYFNRLGEMENDGNADHLEWHYNILKKYFPNNHMQIIFNYGLKRFVSFIVQKSLENGSNEDRVEFFGLLIKQGFHQQYKDLYENMLSRKRQEFWDSFLSSLPFGESLMQARRSKKIVNSRNKEGDPPLIIAAKAGNLLAIQFLIEKGATIDKLKLTDGARDYGHTALYWAIVNNHQECAKYLIEQGADLQGYMIYHLHLASKKGQLTVVQAIIEKMNASKYKNDFKIMLNLPDSNDLTPLIYAALNGHTDTVECLAMNDMELEYAPENGKHKGKTALYLAIEKGHEGCAIALIKKGANITSSTGQSLLILATSLGQTVVVSALCMKSPHSSFINRVNPKFQTALIVAASKGYLEILKQLIAAGANLEFFANNDPKFIGQTALYHAINNGHIKCAIALIEAGANIDLQLPYSLLMLATYAGQIDVVKALLAKYTELNIKNKINDYGVNSQTALMFAARKGQLEILELLIQAGADLDLQTAKLNGSNEQSMTALHYAILHKRHDCAIALIRAGANLYLATSNPQETPLMMALRLGENDVANEIFRTTPEKSWGKLFVSLDACAANIQTILRDCKDQTLASYLKTLLEQDKLLEKSCAAAAQPALPAATQQTPRPR